MGIYGIDDPQEMAALRNERREQLAKRAPLPPADQLPPAEDQPGPGDGEISDITMEDILPAPQEYVQLNLFGPAEVSPPPPQEP